MADWTSFLRLPAEIDTHVIASQRVDPKHGFTLHSICDDPEGALHAGGPVPVPDDSVGGVRDG